MNYRGTRSEDAVGRAVAEGIRLGFITREQVVVCTKGGYLTFGTESPSDPRRWIQDNYVKPGIFTWQDFVAGCHCMTPAYLKNQVDLIPADPYRHDHHISISSLQNNHLCNDHISYHQNHCMCRSTKVDFHMTIWCSIYSWIGAGRIWD